VEWVGGSCIVDADGYPLAGPLNDHSSETILAEVDLLHARDKWISNRNHVLQDRRPELYAQHSTSVLNS
jgi:predicted amidohydrolase